MEAIILAGGRGTRLQSAVNNIPKPLAPIGGRPFLLLLLDFLAAQGFRRILLSVGYCAEVIMSSVGHNYRTMELRYVVEEAPLGTGGALRKALEQVSSSSVFALNGDTFFALDYRAMLLQGRETGAKLTIALRHVADAARYGRVETERHRITTFREKGESCEGWINGGAYLLDKDLFSGYEMPEAFSLEADFIQRYSEKLAPYAFLSDAYFIDIGIPEDYRRAQQEIPLLLG